MCYLLAGVNNKFINGIKEDVGFLLSVSGTSASAIETLANVGLTVRKVFQLLDLPLEKKLFMNKRFG